MKRTEQQQRAAEHLAISVHEAFCLKGTADAQAIARRGARRLCRSTLADALDYAERNGWHRVAALLGAREPYECERCEAEVNTPADMPIPDYVDDNSYESLTSRWGAFLCRRCADNYDPTE